MAWYWFSFTYQGVNQGCCNVEAESQDAALQKTIDLGIHPKHDDIVVFMLDSAELEPNKLFSRKEMIDMKYEPVKLRSQQMGRINIEMYGSFPQDTFSACGEEGGHVCAIKRAIEYLASKLGPAVVLDATLTKDGVDPPTTPLGTDKE